MRFLWTAAYKDFCRLRRDPFALAGWLAIPLVMAVLMQMVFGHDATPHGRLLIADQDHSYLSGKLADAFRTGAPSKFLTVETVEPGAGLARIDRGDGSAFLLIPAGFQSAEMAGSPIRLQLVTNPAQRILPRIIEQVLSIALASSPPQSLLSAFPGAAGSLFSPPAVSPVRIQDRTAPATHTRTFAAVLFPASMYMALLLVANVLAAQLWQEHESGTLRRIRVSPVSLSSFLAGRLLFVAVVFAVVAAVGLAALRELSGAPLHSVPAACAWAVLSGTLFFLGMQWLALSASDRRGANVLGSVVTFPLAAVGGCFLPFSIMPQWLARIGHWTPNGWAIAQFESIVNGGLDGPGIAVRLVGIVALLGLLFPLVVRRLRRKLLG